MIDSSLLRCMAWERAKGELRSMLHTYYESGDRFDRFNEKVKELIDYVEDNGLQE